MPNIFKCAKIKKASFLYNNIFVKGLKKVNQILYKTFNINILYYFCWSIQKKKLNFYIIGLNKTLNVNIKDSSIIIKDKTSFAKIGFNLFSKNIKKTAEKSTSKIKHTNIITKNKRNIKIDNI